MINDLDKNMSSFCRKNCIKNLTYKMAFSYHDRLFMTKKEDVSKQIHPLFIFISFHKSDPVKYQWNN
jgi:hypothetical protein